MVFLAKHSISTNLLIYQNYLIDALDDSYQNDTIYLTFRMFKVFDKVNHTLLNHKLKLFGMDGNFF